MGFNTSSLSEATVLQVMGRGLSALLSHNAYCNGGWPR